MQTGINFWFNYETKTLSASFHQEVMEDASKAMKISPPEVHYATCNEEEDDAMLWQFVV